MLSYQKLERLQALQKNLMSRYISKLVRGEIAVDKYLEVMMAEERTELFFARVFDTFEDFEAYIRNQYPMAAEEQINHERKHFDCAMRHGLKDTKVGLYECSVDSGILVNGVTMCYIGRNFEGWTAGQILEFERENTSLGASDEMASDTDRQINDVFRNRKRMD